MGKVLLKIELKKENLCEGRLEDYYEGRFNKKSSSNIQAFDHWNNFHFVSHAPCFMYVPYIL
jgi:hypothetical protein